ncbi:hypothetical protein [Sphingomonas sp.]|uniref:hypothetical protein n=1 Tax=Sphingomonas sp. TaxID=28214 RepID=UPI0035BC2BA8
MTDFPPIHTPVRRGLRAGTVLVLILLAFAAGLALAVYAVRHVAWFAQPAAVTAAPVQKPQTVVAVAPAVQTDPAALATREAVLAGQLAALEARTATITADAQNAGTQATRAEALLVAFASRRALDRGLGLGYLEAQLRARFGASEPRAVAYIVQASRAPLTLGDLREGLAEIGPDIASGAHEGWAAGVRRELGTLVVIRKDGTPSPLPEDRLARARRLLEGGQVEAARAEVARLPGATQATNWMAAAKRYVTARHALDILESAAIQGAAVQPAAPPPPTVTTYP